MKSLESDRRLYRTDMEKAGISVTSGILAGVAADNFGIGLATSFMAFAWTAYMYMSQDMIIEKKLRKKRTYDLGHFGEIYGMAHRGRTVTLDDGTVIQPGDIIGHMDLSKNLESSLSQNQFAGAFVRSFSYAMVRLANDVEHKRFPKQIKAIVGTSHLARPAMCERLGFTVKDEVNLLYRFSSAYYGVNITRDYDESESYLRLFKREWNHVHQVWMSREQIVASKPLFQDLRRRLKHSKSFNALTA